MKVVLFSYDAACDLALEVLRDTGCQVVGIVVPSNRRGKRIAHVLDIASAACIPTLVQPSASGIEAFLTRLRALQPSIGLIWSYSMVLPRKVIATFERGIVNVHGGLLPEYRGGHVLNWAIINGEKETGVTLHYVDAGIDTGPIIGQQHVRIGRNDDALTVRTKLLEAGERALYRWWPQIIKGTAPCRPQDETAARYYPMRSPEGGRIDWTASSEDIYNLIRALVRPWPGAFTYLGHDRVTIWRAGVPGAGPASEPVPTDTGSVEPGTITSTSDAGLYVRTGNSHILLREIQIGDQVLVGGGFHEAGLHTGIRFGTRR